MGALIQPRMESSITFPRLCKCLLAALSPSTRKCLHFSLTYPCSNAVLLEQVETDWNEVFNNELPKTIEKMIDTVDVSWHQFVASIKNQMQLIDPGIIPYFEGSSAAIDHIRKEVHDRMKEAI